MLSNAPGQFALGICSESARMLQFPRVVSTTVVDCVPSTHLLPGLDPFACIEL
jgi:hypothetical protein